MGCACHGGSRLAVADILAFDQCLFCGMKHLTTAWSLWNEFSYQDLNLAAIDGQLRLQQSLPLIVRWYQFRSLSLYVRRDS